MSLSRSEEYADYDYAIGLLAAGAEPQWQELEQLLSGFPDGVDEFLGRRWIINALDCGSVASVRWMLSRGVELKFRDDEEYTVLHSALDRKGPERYELLEALLRAGADVNAKGINDWTPSHMAAARDDVEALRIFIRYKADLSIRTNIDNYATPLEEARAGRKKNAIEFLESRSRKSRKGRA